MYVRRQCSSILHDNALGAATSLLLSAVHVHLLRRSVGAASTAGATRVLQVTVVLADLANNVVESLLDIQAGLGRGLDEFAVERTGQRLTLCILLATFI